MPKTTSTAMRRSYRIPKGKRVFMGYWESEENAREYDRQASLDGETRTNWMARALKNYLAYCKAREKVV